MSYMDNVYSMKSKYEQQEKVFKRLDALLEAALTVLEKFDGKVINVRIEKAIKEAFPDRDLFISVNHFSKDLSISDDINRSFQAYDLEGNKVPYGLGIVDYYEERVILSKGDRVDYLMCRRNIKEILSRHKEIIEEEKKWIAQSDQVMEEYNKLKDSIIAFTKKYNHTMLNDCGCSFRIIY